MGVPQHKRSQTEQLQSESYTTTAPHSPQTYFFPLFLANLTPMIDDKMFSSLLKVTREFLHLKEILIALLVEMEWIKSDIRLMVLPRIYLTYFLQKSGETLMNMNQHLRKSMPPKTRDLSLNL
jgi:hypothetical protein